jgi:hypothetical protein
MVAILTYDSNTQAIALEVSVAPAADLRRLRIGYVAVYRRAQRCTPLLAEAPPVLVWDR